MASVVVTDGEERSALAVVRSLGRAGHRVHVCSSRDRSLAGASRHAESEHWVPDPYTSPKDFAVEVCSVAREVAADMVLPITEASLHAILPEREAVTPAIVPFPGAAVVKRVCNKEIVLEVAQSLGIAVPAQTKLESASSLDRLDLDRLYFPLVLKPSRSVAFLDGRAHKQSVRQVLDIKTLRKVAVVLPASAYPLLLQQRITGPGIGVFLLMWDGEVLASFSHRRIREKPPSGGVSVFRESISMNPELLECSRKLLERLDWRGVAMVEYKMEEATGRPFLMEVNGRFWGSLQLAIDAGVDFPRLLVGAALGQHTAPVEAYRIGVRTRWFWGDVDHLLSRFRHSREELFLAKGAPGRGRVLIDFCRAFGPRNRSEVFRGSDPRPALLETLAWVRAMLPTKPSSAESGTSRY